MADLFKILTPTQQSDERDMVVLDLFSEKTDKIKPIISELDEKQRKFLIEKTLKHQEFYRKIANEESDKPSYRIAVAKFRANELYPQLLQLLGYAQND